MVQRPRNCWQPSLLATAAADPCKLVQAHSAIRVALLVPPLQVLLLLDCPPPPLPPLAAKTDSPSRPWLQFFDHRMSFHRYWPYDRPPEFVQCVRSFAEARLLRQLHRSAFTIQQPLAPPRVRSHWYVPSRAISEAAPPKKRRRVAGGAVTAQQAAAAGKCDPQQAELRPLQLAAWMRVRVGTAGFISKLLEKLFARKGLQGRDAGKFVRFTLQRTCSACMCSRAFPSMRARPCAADSAEAALIVVSDVHTFPASFLTICSKWPKRFCGTEPATG